MSAVSVAIVKDAFEDEVRGRVLAKGSYEADGVDNPKTIQLLEDANAALIEKVQKGNADLLGNALFVRSLNMKNAFGASDH